MGVERVKEREGGNESPRLRSAGTGLYDRIREEKWPLPQPESLFDLEFFRSNPKPFYARAGSMAPGRYLPTKTHYFFKLLESKGKLLRVYTQNVDTLERMTELSDDVLMEAHGSFHTAGCVECHKEYPQEWILSFLRRADAARREGGAADDADVEVPLCEVCGSPVKPGALRVLFVLAVLDVALDPSSDSSLSRPLLSRPLPSRPFPSRPFPSRPPPSRPLPSLLVLLLSSFAITPFLSSAFLPSGAFQASCSSVRRFRRGSSR